MDAVLPAVVVVTAFFAGAIPFGLLVARWVRGVDVRTIGSGNVGATNVSRVLGTGWFFVIFPLDAAKGVLPVLFFPGLAGHPDSELLAVGCGLAAVLGHVFNPFLHGKGGKGVATTAGVIAALAPVPTLVAVGVFGVAFVLFRYVSLGSICAAVSLVPLALVFGAEWEVVAFVVFAAAVVVLRHRPNIARIAAGTEPRVLLKSEAQRG